MRPRGARGIGVALGTKAAFGDVMHAEAFWVSLIVRDGAALRDSICAHSPTTEHPCTA